MSGDASKFATGKQGFLFASERLSSLSKWDEINEQLEKNNMLARPLKLEDYHAGYLELLGQLTHVGPVTFDAFKERFEQMLQINLVRDHYVIVVIEDKQSNRIIATSTLFLEYKFIHQCGMRGRLEDVAVLESHRKNHLGKLIVKIIVELAHEAYSCYKLTLDCTDELIKFYAKNNFTYGSNMLAIRFTDSACLDDGFRRL